MREKYTDQQIKDFISKPLFNENILLKKDSSYPKISVIIPSFNDGKFIERAILSTLNQNYPNLELIIMDGGSTDETQGIIKKYEKYISYWVSEKDKGQSDALNKGFSRATGDLVNEQDADDIFVPNAFLRVGDYFRKNPKTDIIFGNRLDLGEDDRIISERVYTRFSTTVYFYDGMSVGAQSAFWKRDLFSKIGMYDLNLKLAMDYEFFLKAGLAGARFKYLPYSFSAMRRHKGSNTENILFTVGKEEMGLLDKKYGRKKWLNFPLKIYSLLYRVFNYFLQGDGDYILNGLKRRIKNKSVLSGY